MQTVTVQRTECTTLLSVKIVNSLCPKRNAGRESRPHWINKYPKEIIRNKHTERKNKRWISRELTVCWDKLKTARSQAELNTENDIKTNSKSFSSYPNKKENEERRNGINGSYTGSGLSTQQRWKTIQVGLEHWRSISSMEQKVDYWARMKNQWNKGRPVNHCHDRRKNQST